MFNFVDFSSTSATQRQDQGKLFEKLVKTIVHACGYTDIELRAKISSMEYDIRARGKLDHIPLVGEAKAHTGKIDGTVISSFVGKMFPVWAKDPKTLGVFISTSDFTPDAKDYLGTIIEQKANLRTIIGPEILDILAREVNYPTINQIKAIAERAFSTRPGDTLFLVSDRGDFFVQLLIRKDETRPRAFSIYHHDRSNIAEPAFGKELKTRIPELGELLFWPAELRGKSFLDLETSRIAPIEGSGWFDYKFPAPPDCFVGRAEQRNTFGSFITRSMANKSKVSVFQVLSRSGVGKSSFLLKIQSDMSLAGAISAIADARNLRSTIDLLDLVQEFVQTLNKAIGADIPIPSDLESGILSLKMASSVLKEKGRTGLFFVDQFESLFAKPDLYLTFLDLILDVTHVCSNILFCIARKNDQPTTYDERAKVDLERLREISETIVLEDFSRDEAISLIEHIQDVINQQLVVRLKEMALEFSQGFPWLCKRICSHIISMVDKGASQEELVQAGLKPDELFREELSDLDVAEIDFLRRLVQYLPATLDELSEVFTDGGILTNRVASLQAHRLIRLTGRTYDTYNDVLKEYLKTGKIPFAIKYVFRAGPIATLNLLNRVRANNWRTISDIREKERRSKGGIFNMLRELRLLGLVEYSKGEVKLPEATINAYQDNTIGQLIQNRVRQNGLVKDILDKLSAKERVTSAELNGFMQSSMPLLQVSQETWDFYARTLSSWLDKTKLASVSAKGLVLRRDKGMLSKEEIARAGRGRGVLPSEFFLPSAYVNELIAFLEIVRHLGTDTEKPTPFNTMMQHGDNALDDCRAVGLVAREDGKIVVTPKGKRFLTNIAEAKEILKGFLLSKINISGYLTEISYNPTMHLEVLRRTLAEAGPCWTEATWKWRSKVLANWLVYAELVARKKGKVTSYPSRLF